MTAPHDEYPLLGYCRECGVAVVRLRTVTPEPVDLGEFVWHPSGEFEATEPCGHTAGVFDAVASIATLAAMTPTDRVRFAAEFFGRQTMTVDATSGSDVPGGHEDTMGGQDGEAGGDGGMVGEHAATTEEPGGTAPSPTEIEKVRLRAEDAEDALLFLINALDREGNTGFRPGFGGRIARAVGFATSCLDPDDYQRAKDRNPA